MNKAKVLIVEDDYMTGENIKMYLEKSGYSVPSIAVSGENAIDLVEEYSPDIVLMDIVLDGELDGIQTAEHIHEKCNIPVVFLTSHIDGKTLNRALTAEPFGYIAKPFEERQLLVAVEMALYKDLMVKEKQRLSEELRLMSLFPVVDPNIVIRLDVNGDITYANPSAHKWLNNNEFTNVSELKRLFPVYFEGFLNTPMNELDVHETETNYGGRYYTFKLIPFRDHNAFMVTLSDITAMKRITREFDTFFQAILSSTQVFVITNTEGIIIHVNNAFEKLYGYSQKEAKGSNPHILNPGLKVYYDYGISEKEYRMTFKNLWQDIKNPEKGYWEGGLINRKKDGSLIEVYLVISAVRDNSGTIISYVGMPVDVSHQRKEELATRLEIYQTITEVAETRDNETGAHLKRIGEFSGLIAQRLGLPKKTIQDITIFSPLHDIGKVGIQDSILQAPRKLTHDEFEIMKTHTTLGYQILKGKLTLEIAAEIAHSHHEKYDGSGYPLGLRGDEIPMSARIVALVDVYDALRHERTYKKTWTHEETVEEIKAKSGTHFDPHIVQIFLDLEKSFNRITDIYHE